MWPPKTKIDFERLEVPFFYCAVVATKELQEEAVEEYHIPVIELEGLGNKMAINLPLELAQEFANDTGTVRAVSFLYYNVESLFPSGLQGEENEWVPTFVQINVMYKLLLELCWDLV